MQRQLKFTEAFWGADFCSSAGFDNLSKRLKDGREMCKDVEDFLKNRGKIEDEYSKKLLNLAKSTAGHTEIGTLRRAWDYLKHHTELIAQDHCNMAIQFTDRAKQLSSFMETQKQQRKQEEDVVKKSLKKKTDLYKKNLECKRTYENKCRDLENIGVQIASIKQTGGNTDRLQTKEQKAKADKEKADQQYKDIVATLENARLTWERDMTQLCEVSEHLEIERFNYLQNEMWIHSNMISQLCVDNDEHCEQTRLEIEKCDVDADLGEVIREKSTGTQKPTPVRYVAYLDNDISYQQHPTRPPLATPNRPPLPPNHPPR